MQPLLQGDLNGAVNGALGLLNPIFPNATTADYCDLIAWMMASGLPSDLGVLQNGQMYQRQLKGCMEKGKNLLPA